MIVDIKRINEVDNLLDLKSIEEGKERKNNPRPDKEKIINNILANNNIGNIECNSLNNNIQAESILNSINDEFKDIFESNKKDNQFLNKKTQRKDSIEAYLKSPKSDTASNYKIETTTFSQADMLKRIERDKNKSLKLKLYNAKDANDYYKDIVT
jgi:hypothetical protein